MGIQLNGITGDAIIPGDVGIGGTLTYEDVANVDSIGIITARTDVLVGSTIKLGASSGVVTATKFVGDGANLTGVSGFSTALGDTQGTLDNLIFKTTEAFTIGSGTSVRVESDNMSGNTAFTRLSKIIVSTGATFHVSSGTTFIMNVLDVFPN